MLVTLIPFLTAAVALRAVLGAFTKSKEASEDMLEAYGKALERAREHRKMLAQEAGEAGEAE